MNAIKAQQISAAKTNSRSEAVASEDAMSDAEILRMSAAWFDGDAAVIVPDTSFNKRTKELIAGRAARLRVIADKIAKAEGRGS